MLTHDTQTQLQWPTPLPTETGLIGNHSLSHTDTLTHSRTLSQIYTASLYRRCPASPLKHSCTAQQNGDATLSDTHAYPRNTLSCSPADPLTPLHSLTHRALGRAAPRAEGTEWNSILNKPCQKQAPSIQRQNGFPVPSCRLTYSHKHTPCSKLLTQTHSVLFVVSLHAAWTPPTQIPHPLTRVLSALCAVASHGDSLEIELNTQN